MTRDQRMRSGSGASETTRLLVTFEGRSRRVLVMTPRSCWPLSRHAVRGVIPSRFLRSGGPSLGAARFLSARVRARPLRLPALRPAVFFLDASVDLLAMHFDF